MNSGGVWKGRFLVCTSDRYGASSAKGQCTSYEIHACVNIIVADMERLIKTHT